MLSKRMDIPDNRYKDTIYPIVDQCFSGEYIVSKVNDHEFMFKRILPKVTKGRDSMRRLTVLDRGVIRIEDRTMWIILDVKRIIFFNVFFDLLLVYIYWTLNFLLFPLVFSLVFALTVFGWFMMIQIGNSFINEKIALLKKKLN